MQALELKQIKKSFGANKVLKGVSLSVQPGEIFGYLGPNGAGKTTTIRCLLDFIRPDSGSIKVFGHDSQTDGPAARQQVSYLSAENQLYLNWTGKDHIDFVCQTRGCDRQVAHRLMNRLSYDDSRKVRHLSTGNRQKLAIIMALLAPAKLLILDEPTRGLDPLLQNVFHQLVREFCQDGGTVFMSSHNLAEVEELCDRVAIIRSGTIVSDETIDSIKSKSLYSVRIVSAKRIDQATLKALKATTITQEGNVTRFELKGQSGQLVAALAPFQVKDLEVTRSTLEELFTELYHE